MSDQNSIRAEREAISHRERKAWIKAGQPATTAAEPEVVAEPEPVAETPASA